MNTYYVEVYNPPCPSVGHKMEVHSSYPGDSLSPDLVMLFEVQGVDKQDAKCRVLLGEARTLISPGGRN